MRVLWILVVAMMAFFVFSQRKACAEELKTFPLEKAMPDRVFACFEEKDATELAQVLAKGDQVETDIASFAKVRRGLCGSIATEVVYHKLIFSQDTDDHYTVYSASVGKRLLFVVMKGWTHESI